MDLEPLKEALGDETFTELNSYVEQLIGQRDHAKSEQINNRKGMKEQITALEKEHSELLEKLGIDSFDEIDDLVTTGSAEVAKQYEAKLNRLGRELKEATDKATATDGKYRDSLKTVALSDAFGSHDFVANDVVKTFVTDKLIWEGDELLFKQDDGNLVSVKDGVAGFARSRPELLKPTGAGGAGVRSSNARGNDGQSTMSRAEFEALPPKEQMAKSKEGVTLQ